MPHLVKEKEKEKEKEKKYDMKLMGSQVVLYVDQRRRVKQKSDNLRTN